MMNDLDQYCADEEEIDESLALPEVLRNLPLKEKKQLLIFKNSHSEVYCQRLLS